MCGVDQKVDRCLRLVDVLNDGKELDYAAERKNKPTIFLFVQGDKFDRPVGRFLKVLDTELAKDRADVHIVAVWLVSWLPAS